MQKKLSLAVLTTMTAKQHLADQLRATDVLIVDENSDDLQYYCELFEDQGFRVFQYDSYHGAIHSILLGLTVDFAVVDQGWPSFEARVVLRCLKPLTPFVVLTRNKSKQCYIEAMDLGATDYLEKPVSLAQVERVLRQAFRSRVAVL